MSRTIQSAAYLMAFILLGFILACGGIGFAYQQKLTGKYWLQATDTLEQVNICEMSSDDGNVCGGSDPGDGLCGRLGRAFHHRQAASTGRQDRVELLILPRIRRLCEQFVVRASL